MLLLRLQPPLFCCRLRKPRQKAISRTLFTKMVNFPVNYLERSVVHKKIVWLERSNRYMLVEIPAYDVIKMVGEGLNREETINLCRKSYHLPKSKAGQFVDEILYIIEYQENNQNIELHTFNPSFPITIPGKFALRKNYLIKGFCFSIEFETEQSEFLIHPKIAHLEVATNHGVDQLFQVFQNNGFTVLMVNQKIIGQWTDENTNYFTGKFSMELLNLIYKKHEPDWMGVFHASAIRKGDQCVLFLGGSGSGKSTISALLMANGYDLLADDFVPVGEASCEVFFFPAAISVKKNALDYLIPFYPQLATAKEFYYQGLDKTVRYLPPMHHFENQSISYPCKALVFVKYDKSCGLTIQRIAQDVAFQLLVPDSWISPLPENASRFLDWFLKMPCYQLTYSDNEMMLETIDKLFRDDL